MDRHTDDAGDRILLVHTDVCIEGAVTSSAD